ncbi:MAG: PHP domain-containing protein [Polyangiales bacterium]
MTAKDGRHKLRRGWLAIHSAAVFALVLVVATMWTRADGDSSDSPTYTTGPTNAREVSPSIHLPPRELVSLGKDLRAYNPHRPSSHRWMGSDHTHAEDHSNISAETQERRFRELGHDFIWLTSHELVVPDPSVDGILHMFGVEAYGANRGDEPGPHWLALLPDARLAATQENPFGRYRWKPEEMIDRIAEEGGLPVLAHPSRYSLPKEKVAELGERLWGIEGLTSRTSSDEDMPWVDARLSAGEYVCVSAGTDTHEEDWSLMRGYQLVDLEQVPPTREQLFEQIRECNFFACTVDGPQHPRIEEPKLTISKGEIVFSVSGNVDRLELVGRGGRTLATASDTDGVSYRPSGDEVYVRARARRAAGNAECLSQAVWLYPRP